MGRSKKTESERNLEGYPDKRATRNEHEVPIPTRCPKTFSPKMRKVWKRLAPHFIAMKKLTILNLDAFTELCYLIVAIQEIREFIAENNQSRIQEKNWVDSSGQEHLDLKESAYSKMYRDYSKQLLSYLKSFGLTPDKMAGVYKPEETKDPMEKYID